MRLVWAIIPLVLFSIVGISESFAQECDTGRELIFKLSNGKPACVTPTTALKLIERGWGMMPTEPAEISEDACKVEPDPGLCRAAFVKYYFNSETQTCEQFIWGGCQGTVPFNTLSECQMQCEVSETTPVHVVGATNVIDANNQFAINFYSGIAQESDDNIFFSPWSISTAFAIAFEGAKEKTADEIQQVFGFPDDYTTRTSEFQSAIASLNPEDALYQLSVANALWLDEGFEPFPEYVDTAATYYDSEVSTVEFDGNEGVDKINAWVEEKTQEKIKDILAPGSTDSLTRMAITNAIYFKGNWVTQFNENNTRDDPFWITSDESVDIPMMRLENTILNFTQTESMQVLRMPYEGDRLSMLVLLPNDKDGLSELEESLTVENLKQWNDQLYPGQIHVYMPKFKLETTYDLKSSLIEMGMLTPFSEGAADFGGIAPIYLFISQAIHKAFVDVNEEGTEAAAATVIMMMTTSEKPPTPIFRADHPFVFLIQDDSTGNILFIGRMMEPPQES